MSYVAAEPGVLISPTDDLQSPRSAPAAHDENADGITGGTRDDSAPNSRFQLGRRIPEATAQEGFLVRPFTQQCQIIHTEGDHAVIGVSPGNSYFSRQRLRDLGLWGLTNFDRVDFVYTDVHVAESYEALGDSAIEARRKAVKKHPRRPRQDHHHGERTRSGRGPAVRSSDVGVPVQRGIPGAACGPAHAPERRRGLARRLPGPSAALPVHESGSAAGGDGYSRAGVHGLHLRRGPAIPRHTCDSRSAVVVELLPPITAPRRNALRPRIGTTGIAQSRPRHCYP